MPGLFSVYAPALYAAVRDGDNDTIRDVVAELRERRYALGRHFVRKELTGRQLIAELDPAIFSLSAPLAAVAQRRLLHRLTNGPQAVLVTSDRSSTGRTDGPARVPNPELARQLRRVPSRRMQTLLFKSVIATATASCQSDTEALLRLPPLRAIVDEWGEHRRLIAHSRGRRFVDFPDYPELFARQSVSSQRASASTLR